jgi:hypothetical protein
MHADMERLERAARMTMGSFQDTALEILPHRPVERLARRLLGLAIAAVLLSGFTLYLL